MKRAIALLTVLLPAAWVMGRISKPPQVTVEAPIIHVRMPKAEPPQTRAPRWLLALRNGLNDNRIFFELIGIILLGLAIAWQANRIASRSADIDQVQAGLTERQLALEERRSFPVFEITREIIDGRSEYWSISNKGGQIRNVEIDLYDTTTLFMITSSGVYTLDPLPIGIGINNFMVQMDSMSHTPYVVGFEDNITRRTALMTQAQELMRSRDYQFMPLADVTTRILSISYQDFLGVQQTDSYMIANPDGTTFEDGSILMLLNRDFAAEYVRAWREATELGLTVEEPWVIGAPRGYMWLDLVEEYAVPLEGTEELFQ